MLIRQLGLGGSSGGGVDSVIRVLGKSGAPITLIQPAATFTAVTPTDGGGGTIVLTSAGAHGLTAARAVGSAIYISGGTGWTAGFYPVTAVPVDTTGTTFTITGTFDGGMGAPTIALANTEVTLASVVVPANSMGQNGAITIDPTFTSNDTSVTSKTYRVRFGGIIYYGPPVTTSQNNHPALISIHNRGAANSQVGSFSVTSNSQVGAVTGSPATSSIDTTQDNTITFTVQPAAENIVCRLERYLVLLYNG